MSPEVVFKKPYDENIDVWSLGVLLFELLHGRSAFKAKSLNEITMKLSKPIDLLFDSNLSEDVKDLIKGILKKEANERLNMKQIFEHNWVKRMLQSEEFEKNQLNNRNSDFLKSLQKPPVGKPLLNRDYKKRTYTNYQYNKCDDFEEKPFQKISTDKENIKHNKKLYSFQALDQISKDLENLKLKSALSFEKENNNDINKSIKFNKKKIFEDEKPRQFSPKKILRSMENFIYDFDRKTPDDEKSFVSKMFKKYEIK